VSDAAARRSARHVADPPCARVVHCRAALGRAVPDYSGPVVAVAERAVAAFRLTAVAAERVVAVYFGPAAAVAELAVVAFGLTAFAAGRVVAVYSGPAVAVAERAVVVAAAFALTASAAGRVVAVCFGPAVAVAELAVVAVVFGLTAVAVEHAAVPVWLAFACSVAVRDGLAFRPAVLAVRRQEQKREAKTKSLCW